MFRSIFIALVLTVFMSACASGTVDDLAALDLEGNYDLKADETENTCNPDGPRGEFSTPLSTLVTQDDLGNVSFWGGGLQLSLALTSNDGVHKLSLDKGDCLFEGIFGGLSGSKCSDEGVTVTFDGTYDSGKLWISGSMQLDYTASCGTDSTGPGSNKIMLEGGQEPSAYQCRDTALYCYTDASCSSLLPGCVAKVDDCPSLAQSSRQVGGECQAVPASTSSALTQPGASPSVNKLSPFWQSENFNPQWYLMSPTWLTHQKFKAYFDSLK